MAVAVLGGARELGVRELIEKHVGFTIADAVALLDDRSADRLGEVIFPGGSTGP
jgi:hypothetical protein